MYRCEVRDRCSQQTASLQTFANGFQPMCVGVGMPLVSESV